MRDGSSGQDLVRRQKVGEMGSVTVHIPLATLREFQKRAQSQNRSESDLAKEAFETFLRRERDRRFA